MLPTISVPCFVMTTISVPCFVLISVVCRVCGRRRHVIDDTALSVSEVYSCHLGQIWDSKLHDIPIPSSVHMDDMDEIKKKFLMSNHAALSKLNEHLSGVHSELKCTKESATLVCQLSSKTKNLHKLASEWKKQSVKSFSEYMESNIVSKKILVSEEAWKQFTDRLQSISMDNPSEVGVFLSHETHSVDIAGHTKFVSPLTTTMTEIKVTIENQIQRLKHQTSKTMANQKASALRLLQVEKVLTEIENKFENLKIEAIPQHGIVKLLGVPQDITSAQVEIMKKVLDLVQVRHTEISECQRTVLKRKTVKLYISAKLKSMSIRGQWEITPDGVLAYAMPGDNADKFEKIMKYSVEERCLPLSDASMGVLKSPEWGKKIDQLNEDEKVLVCILSDNVCIVSTDDIHGDVVRDVEDFIENNSLRVRKYYFDQHFLKFMKRHCGNDFEKMKRLQKVHLTISDNAVCIEGRDDDINKTEGLLKERESRIKHHACKIDRRIQVQLLQSHVGMSVVRKVEDENRCIIQGLEGSVPEDTDDSYDFCSDGGAMGMYS